MNRKQDAQQQQMPCAARKNGRGFTVVELCVVLALLAILGTVTVSFCVMIGDYTGDVQAEYDFLEDSAAVRASLTEKIRQSDTPDTVFTVTKDGTLAVGESTLSFSSASGTLRLGAWELNGLDSIGGVSVSTNGTLIRCVLHRRGATEEDTVKESVIVLSLRCGTVLAEVSE